MNIIILSIISSIWYKDFLIYIDVFTTQYFSVIVTLGGALATLTLVTFSFNANVQVTIIHFLIPHNTTFLYVIKIQIFSLGPVLFYAILRASWMLCEISLRGSLINEIFFILT